MKTRQGFVSNSSSSSFVCWTTIELAEQALRQMSTEEQELVRDNLVCDSLSGIKVCGYSHGDGGNGSFVNGDEDYSEDIWHVLQDWHHKVKSLGVKDAMLTHEVDL